ncbi:hypothetical protein JXO52_04575 [bacterium]|nr:hypothetical protein [bacterium]
MHCPTYDAYDTGTLSEEEFHLHARQCGVCRELIRQDERLLRAAASLQEPVDTAGVWPGIEARLLQERRAAAASRSRTTWILRVAAVLVCGVVLTRLLAPGWPAPPDLLPRTALAEVEQAEQAYAQAISRLEREAAPVLESMDTELALLYRDKLETIDIQISRCRNALQENPGNTHIRRYMLAALQDKKETLREVVRGTSHRT